MKLKMLNTFINNEFKPQLPNDVKSYSTTYIMQLSAKIPAKNPRAPKEL